MPGISKFFSMLDTSNIAVTSALQTDSNVIEKYLEGYYVKRMKIVKKL